METPKLVKITRTVLVREDEVDLEQDGWDAYFNGCEALLWQLGSRTEPYDLASQPAEGRAELTGFFSTDDEDWV